MEERDSETGWRFRQNFKLTHPLGTNTQLYLSTWDEVFLNLNDTDWGARKGFDQLRSFAGVEIGLPGASTMEVGYLNQLIDQSGSRQRVNHVASVTLFFRH